MPEAASLHGAAYAVDAVGAPKPEADRASVRTWAPVIVGVCAILALQFDLVFTKSINWDEFFFFSMIEQLRDGLLTHALQTFPARIFAFLTLLPLDPIGQLLAGRTVMFGCELVTCAAIFGVARRFCDDRSAAFCSATYLSAGYVLLHGFAFRADPLVTALLMAALWCVVTRKFDWKIIALASVLVGVAGAVSIKAAFYAPAFLGGAWLRWTDAKATDERIARPLAAIAAGSALAFGGILLAHQTGIRPAQAHAHAGGLALGTVFARGFLPQAEHLRQQILLGPVAAMLVLAAPLFWSRLAKAERLAMAGFLAPILTVAVYRNSYPYYFVFILAPASITLGLVIERVVKSVGAWPYAALLTANCLALNLAEPKGVLAEQRLLVDGVHRIFPRPVAYFDASGMIGDFPRPLSILVSGWGLQNYRNGAEPSFVDLANARPVPLLILDDWTIDAAVKEPRWRRILLPADLRMLKENYLPHWGMVWVAGKRIPGGSGTSAAAIVVPGTYTVEGASVAIDGRRMQVGDRVQLARGVHSFTANPMADATIRWGDHLPIPRQAPPRLDSLFTEY